jgi:uncharacterized membrane protein YkgB
MVMVFPEVFTMVYSHEEVMNRLSIFNAWFIGRYMNESQTTIIALHIDNVQPRCRNQYPSNNNPIVPGIRPTFLAAILGAPELAVQVSSFIGFLDRYIGWIPGLLLFTYSCSSLSNLLSVS